MTIKTSQKNRFFIPILVFSLHFSSASFGSDFQKNELDFSAGLSISSLTNDNVSLLMANDVVNTYNTQQSTNVNVISKLGYARRFNLKENITVTVGPSFYYTNLDGVDGIEYPLSNHGNHDTLNYRYLAQSFAFMAESRAIYEKYCWQPFVTMGIGPSFNRLSGYEEVATDSNGSAAPGLSVFQNNIKTQFSYMAGLGVQRIFHVNSTRHITYLTALSYRYFNFGQATLQPAALQTTAETLKVNTLDTQAVLFSVSAIF